MYIESKVCVYYNVTTIEKASHLVLRDITFYVHICPRIPIIDQAPSGKAIGNVKTRPSVCSFCVCHYRIKLMLNAVKTFVIVSVVIQANTLSELC